MDPTNFIPIIAGWLHMTPTSLLADLILISMVANAIAKLIPNDATGWKATLRSICSFIGINISSRVTSGVTIADTAKATLSFPEVAAKVAASDTPETKP